MGCGLDIVVDIDIRVDVYIDIDFDIDVLSPFEYIFPLHCLPATLQEWGLKESGRSVGFALLLYVPFADVWCFLVG